MKYKPTRTPKSICSAELVRKRLLELIERVDGAQVLKLYSIAHRMIRDSDK